MEILLNKNNTKEYKVRELSTEYQNKLGIKVAQQTLKDNGIDEVFFEHNNKKYVLASDNVNLSGIKKISIKGETVKLIGISNEDNSNKEKVKTLSLNALKSGISNGVGGALGGIAITTLKLSQGSIGKAALIGFISGFCWGAGSSITSDLINSRKSDWKSIDDISK